MKNIFIIVNYNDYENTKKLIDNIRDYKVINKILIIDNCSKVECFQQLKNLTSDKIIVLKTEENKGYGSAINYGAKYCKEKFKECNLIISNSDIEISKEEDLITLTEEINKKNDVSIISPVIRQNDEYSYGWKRPTILDAIIMNIPKINRKYENKRLKYKKDYFESKTKEVQVVSGCFFIMRLEDLEKINYFDENIFLYYEENIISYKLKSLNKKILLNPNVEIKHNHSKTIDKNINEYNKLKELKKSQYYYYKNIVKSNKFALSILKLTNKIILYIKKVKVGK